MFRRPAPLALILILLATAIAAVVWQRSAQSNGNISAPESITFYVLRPVQRVLTGVGDWFSDVGRTIFRRGGVLEENEKLRGEVANLRGQTQRLWRYQRENTELRRLLGLKKPEGGTSIAADVVSMDATSFARRITLNIGQAQGVRSKDVVFVAQGVVGQVVQVSRNTSKVILLTDRESGVGAMSTRTMAKGWISGTGARTLQMSFLDYNSDVREGDLVVTSGLSEIYPRGLIVGRVLRVERNKSYSRLSAEIDPAVPFDQLSAVFVRTGA
jgi:rod shape-determining protein MreC